MGDKGGKKDKERTSNSKSRNRNKRNKGSRTRLGQRFRSRNPSRIHPDAGSDPDADHHHVGVDT